MGIVYDKFVRDNIPEIIESKKFKVDHTRNFDENDYKVYDGDQIEEKMINEIDLLDKQFFKEEHLWETNYQLQLFNKNKNSLIMVKYNNKCVGYLNYLVIIKEKYDKMINSNIIVDEFDFDDVIIFYKNKGNYLTINSVVVNKEHQDSYVVRILTKRLKEILKKMNSDKYQISGMNSFAVSDDGKKFLENLGFEQKKKLEDGYYLYVLEGKCLEEYLK